MHFKQFGYWEVVSLRVEATDEDLTNRAKLISHLAVIYCNQYFCENLNLARIALEAAASSKQSPVDAGAQAGLPTGSH